MPFDQNQLPTWNKEGVEPPQSLKDSGWQPSQKPPADYFNWFFYKTYNALKSLFTNAQHKEEKGQPNGYASLDENAKVPTSQLPIATTTSPGAISASDKAKLDGIQSGAEPNQNAFSNVKVGTTTISADSKTDTLELVAGQNIVLTPDAANDKVTIDVTGVAPSSHTHPFSDITNKPTTVDGYGITDAVKTSDVVTSPAPNKILKLDSNGKLPASITGNADGNAATASKLQTARTISLTGDATGSTSFDGSSNASIAVTLANSGVTPGIYPKVTVDSKGRVTGGQSLSPADIPNLDWSKITSGKPTTLAGYGITDAIPANQKGAANGVASLDGSAKVPTSQLPSASTSAPGIVQLVDSVSSTSTTQAPTANAVKQAYDRAVSAENNAKAASVPITGGTMTGDLTINQLKIKNLNGSSGGTVKWYKVARIQFRSNPNDSGEIATFTGTLFVQRDYGNTANQTIGQVNFSFGVRGGTIKPVIFATGDGAALTNNSGYKFRVYKDADGWHYLYFMKPYYSNFATFLYRADGCTEYWIEEDPSTVQGLTLVWDSDNGATQDIYVGKNKVWHAGNDGAGSGLDADTVDGYQVNPNGAGWNNTIPVNRTDGVIEVGRYIDMHNSATSGDFSVRLDAETEDSLNILGVNTTDGLKVNSNKVWHAGNDGPGSGLDADTVDGKHFSDIQADAQAKANQAEANAKAYTDSAPEAMQRNLGIFNVYKSGKDSNGIFTIVEYKRADGTLYARSVLSGGTSPQYTTRTITYYAADGTTVIRTDPYTLVYDADGDLISEVKQ
jgi:Phage tail fibre repeat